MFKSISKYSWFSFVPFVTLAFVTVCLFLDGIIPLSYLWLTLFGWVMTAGLGVAVGYHRIFSHNNYPDLPKWKENFILFWGTMSGEGSAITWTAIHRGYHHRHADTERDIHTPVGKGFYHAFFGWATKITEDANIINLKYAANLLRKPNVIWFHEHQMTILWLTPIVTAIVFGWQVALALFILPTGITLLQDNLVNVFGHTKAGIGYRNFEIGDRSQNNVILGYLGWGQGWHNNHHYQPAAYDFGKGVSGRWWEWDPCNIFKPFLK